jgi:predicted MFS family arabinose efflux permease
VLGLWVARLAERWDRTKLLTACILLWSAFTALCGAAGSFSQLLVLRVGVAVGEAGATPTGHSLISDYYPAEKRAGALGVFSFGNTIGTVLGALLGGFAGLAWGWRWTFVAAASPGLILAVLTFFTLEEPRKVQPVARADVPPTAAVIRLLFGKAAFRHLAAATALTLFAAYGVINFITPDLIRSYGVSLKSASLIGGVGGGLALGAGTLVGGFVSQRLARRDERWMMWTPGWGLLLAAGACAAAFLSPELLVTAVFFLVMSLGVATFQAPLFATTHAFVHPRMRATASAVMLLVITLFGLGLGPLCVGFASDRLAAAAFGSGNYATVCRAGAAAAPHCAAASAEGLRTALVGCSAVFAWASAHFFIGAGKLRGAMLDVTAGVPRAA